MSESICDLIEQGGGLLRYTAATRYSELRLIAGPATLDIGPLDLGVEDHATNAPLTAQRSEQALELLQDILAIELLTASTMAVDPAHRPADAGADRGGVRRRASGPRAARAASRPRPSCTRRSAASCAGRSWTPP